MNVLEVNFADKVGHIFNGYDLHKGLIESGINAKQIVADKRSSDDSVVKLQTEMILHQQIREIEKRYSISNLLYPYGTELENMDDFRNADIVHYHILHNGMISLLDYPELMNQRPSVWTIHDPWILTGNCVYPLECQQWKQGCKECARYDDPNSPMDSDNTAFMWKVKREILAQINPYIVVSCDFMKDYLLRSPLTRHFNKITVIPFGIHVEKFNVDSKRLLKEKFMGKNDSILIGFRVENNFVKGNQYLFDALRKIKEKEKFELICVGSGRIPNDIIEKFNIRELGWVDDESKMIDFLLATDIFVMPSLAETFGVMAIEAMAAACCLICFQDTVLEEITNSPNCGIAVKYRSAEAIYQAIERLAENPEEMIKRGRRGHSYVARKFQFDNYVEKHKSLYERILE